jgi:copper chaperone CopZ
MTIRKELEGIRGVHSVEGNPQSKTVDVQWEPPATEAEIRATLTEINFPAAA